MTDKKYAAAETMPWSMFKQLAIDYWCLFTDKGEILDGVAADDQEDNDILFKTRGDSPETVYHVPADINQQITIYGKCYVDVVDDKGTHHMIRFLQAFTITDKHRQLKTPIATDDDGNLPPERLKMVLKIEVRAKDKAGLEEALDVAIDMRRVEGFSYNHREKDGGDAELTIEVFEDDGANTVSNDVVIMCRQIDQGLELALLDALNLLNDVALQKGKLTEALQGRFNRLTKYAQGGKRGAKFTKTTMEIPDNIINLSATKPEEIFKTEGGL